MRCTEKAYEKIRGLTMIDDFLGYFFIKRYTWSTTASIKNISVSIRKYYKCLMDCKEISKREYWDLCDTFKEKLPKGQSYCIEYKNSMKQDII